MKEIFVKATPDSLSIEGHSWSVRPGIEEICAALGSTDLTDGHEVTIARKAVARFRYFEEMGIGVLETIPGKRVKRITFYLIGRQPGEEIPKAGSRPTAAAFEGRILLNGKQMHRPVRAAGFPLTGAFIFVNRMALGGSIGAFFGIRSGFVDLISFEFDGEED